MRTIAFAFVILGLVACHRGNDLNVPPPDASDASVVVDTDVDGSVDPDADFDAASPCGRACARLSSLHCPEAKPSRAGTSCTTVCTMNKDLLPVACVGTAQTLADVRACGVRCTP